MKSDHVVLLSKTLFIGLVFVLFVLASIEYRGEWYAFLIFSITANGLLYFGFRNRAIFFDTFIGIFLWLGFWLKLAVRVAFADSQLHDRVGNFDGSGAAFDSALLSISLGFTGLMVASYIRGRFFYSYSNSAVGITQPGLHEFYQRYRTLLLLGFAVLIVAVAVSNFYLGFYQRGSITRTVLPFGLNGVYKWLILFGLASISAIFLKFEYFDNRNKSYTVALLAIFETFASNVSLLSRGMILNLLALTYGFTRTAFLFQIKTRLGFTLVCVFVMVALFGSSVFLVNTIRTKVYQMSSSEKHEQRFDVETFSPEKFSRAEVSMTVQHTQLLFLDRWVGIEGFLAVSSYPNLGWEFWRSALKEKYSQNALSFYDYYLIDSPYKNTDLSKHHFVSLPGIVAFCFYPGSNVWLFVCMILVGLFAGFLEWVVYRLGGQNLILCALIGQVIAYRYASFGYVPAQSYLLFGAIMLNVIIIYIADRILAVRYRPD